MGLVENSQHLMKHLQLIVALLLTGAFSFGNSLNAQTTTFNADMGCAPDFYEVFVTGPWCGWCANDGTNQLTDADGDGVYTVAIDGLSGVVEYKYAIDGFTDQENLINDMVDGASCAPVTDLSGYANRTTDAGTTTSDYYGTCDGVCNDNPPVTVTFQVDMADYTGAFGTVNLNGSFNGWCGGCAVMTDDDADGVYSVDVVLNAQATVEYKFTVDGWTDQESLIEGMACTSTIDGYTNRTLTTGAADQTLDVVCWNSCGACTGVVAENIMVTWQVDMTDAGVNPAGGVRIAGGFQGWDATSSPMSDAGNGVWTYSQEVPGNSYLEWKYINGAGWGFEESVPGACANSSSNRFFQAGTEDVTIDLVCFGECVGCDVEVVEYEVTFNVNMANETVAETGVYLAGGASFGNPGDNEMTDPDGDGIYSITVMLDEGLSGYYTFTNGACGDWSCKENLEGLECGDPTNYNDRFLPAIAGPTTISTCFGQCSTDGTCEPVDVSPLTLTVDVCDATPSAVSITGPWWGWDPAGGPIATDNGDGTWSVVLDPSPTDNMEYLWVVDGVQENLIQAMVDGGACAPVTDYANYANRLWEVGSGDASSVYGSCSACETESTGVTLTVDVCDAMPTQVRITGPWWGWDPNGGPAASDNGDGTWSVVLDPAPTDNMEYLWVVDGVQENLIQSMVDGGSCAPITDYANYANRLWEVGSGEASSVYGTCGSCGDVTGPVMVTVDFAIDMNTTGFPNADYDNIVINGSWNEWGAWGITLADADGDGIFTGSLDLEEGSTFEFVIAATGPADGYSGWGSIFNAPTECEANPGLPIGQGGGNYIHTAMDGSMVQYCAGSCEATCPIPGCTDPFYTEFDMMATADDGSCATLVVFGCIYEAADNYNNAANTDDGSCEFTLNACPGDLDGDGLVATPDLLQFLSVFGTNCE